MRGQQTFFYDMIARLGNATIRFVQERLNPVQAADGIREGMNSGWPRKERKLNKSELLKQFEKGTVKILGFDKNQTVKALIYKGLAVCQMPAGWVNEGKWSITHVKSGVSVNCGIGPWPKQYRWKALFLAWALAQEAGLCSTS